jgi:uncharacterized protein (DUF1330 family)
MKVRVRLVAICVLALLAGAASLPAASPKGYAVAEITVTHPVAYKKYLAAVTPVVAQFGGKYLVRAGRVIPLEGQAPAGRFIVIEFPSLAVAQQFEDSPQYKAIAPLRKKASRTRLFLVEGAAEAQAAR